MNADLQPRNVLAIQRCLNEHRALQAQLDAALSPPAELSAYAAATFGLDNFYYLPTHAQTEQASRINKLLVANEQRQAQLQRRFFGTRNATAKAN